jgi:hypothetical protein
VITSMHSYAQIHISVLKYYYSWNGFSCLILEAHHIFLLLLSYHTNAVDCNFENY